MSTFRPHEHLRRPADARRSASNDWLIIYAAPNERHYSRLGLSVSRKYGGAVQRNRLRRLYREGYRLSKSHVPPGLDLVFIPRGTSVPALADLLAAIPKLVGQIAKRLARDAGKAAETPP